jgi:hypothetical protein
MKRAILLTVILLLVVGSTLAQETSTEPGKKAAESWLALVDKADYAASYDQAAGMFKSAIGKADWQQKIKAARDPLGKVLSRKLKSAQYTTSLPGAPDGQYVVMQYDTSFENKKSAVETIVPMLDKDGQWHISGYFIR